MTTRIWIPCAALLVATSLLAIGDSERPAVEPDAMAELTIGTKVGQRLPRFTAEAWSLAQQPTKAAHDSHALPRPTAYVFLSRSCPYCKQYQQRLADLARTYGARGIDFVMIYPTRETLHEDKVAYHKQAGFPGAFVNDRQAAVATALKIRKTPEVVLVDARGAIVFRGGIDDSPNSAKDARKRFLRDACEDVVAGRAVRVTGAPLYG